MGTLWGSFAYTSCGYLTAQVTIYRKAIEHKFLVARISNKEVRWTRDSTEIQWNSGCTHLNIIDSAIVSGKIVLQKCLEMLGMATRARYKLFRIFQTIK